jgi:putative ABC transport system permease protein
MTTFGRELRQAWRSLLKRKAYFFGCAATLALVLGANAAMFAVVNATMLRPMPFAAGGEVLRLFSQPPGTSGILQRNPLQQMEVPRLRERLRTLARLEGFLLSERVITRSGEPVATQTATVTAGLLPMMAAPLAQGRGFLAGEEQQPGHLVAVISDRYWRDAFGGGNVIGSALVIDDQPHTIVGILAPSFAVPFLNAHVFTPLYANPEPQPRAPPRSVVGLAEMAPGVSLAQVRDELSTINRQLAAEFPRTHSGWLLGAQTAREWQYGPMRAPLLMLFAATGFVLLIACVNIANLTSAQAMARSGELALRLALGGSRADIARLHLAELSIVVACGLGAGLLLASAAVPAVLAINPTIAQSLGAVTIDWRVQLFSALAAIFTAVAAAAVPAIRAMRGHVAPSIAAGGSRTTGSAATIRLQRGLVAIEVALCVALLMAGAVVVQGLRDLTRRSPGYHASGILTAQVRLPDASYKTPELRAAVVDRMLERVRALPGVDAASVTQNAFVPSFSYQTLIHVKDRPTADGQPHTVQFRRVSPDYFRTMQIRMLKGRVFETADTAAQPHVAVISRQFADRLMPAGDPIGQVLMRTSNTLPPLTVVGVVDDALDVSVTQAPEPTLYLPWAQNNNFGVPVAFVIRTSVDPASLTAPVREAIRSVDAALPLRRVQLLDTFVTESTAPERFRTMVLGIIAALGLILAAVGIAGVTYRGVIDRTKEFAVRLALGSQPHGIVRMVVAESARDLGIGAAAGLAAGVALCLLLASTMEHIGAIDALGTAAAVGVFAVVGILAASLPALRILRVHPAEVLRR